MKGSRLLILVAALLLAGILESAVISRGAPAKQGRKLLAKHHKKASKKHGKAKHGKAAKKASKKKAKKHAKKGSKKGVAKRHLQGDAKAADKAQWVHDPQAVKKLEKYAITSLMTMISLKIAQDIDSKTAKQSPKVQERKLGAIGKFVHGQSMEDAWAKEKKDLRRYLQKNKVSVRRGLKLADMASITGRYMQDKFGISSRKFGIVKDLIGGIYRVSQRKMKKVNL